MAEPTKEEIDGFYIGAIVLTALWIVPLLVLFFISLCTARRKADPAREGITPLKIAYAFFIVALLFAAIGLGLTLFLRTAPANAFKTTLDASYMDEASNRLLDIARFLGFLGDIFLIFSLVELASGFLHANTGTPSSARKWLKWSAFGWSIFFFILVISNLGFSENYLSNVYKLERVGTRGSTLSSTDARNLQRKLVADGKTLNKLGGALVIILWISSLPILAYAAFVVHKTRKNTLLCNSAILFLSAVVVNVVRLLCNMAIYANQYLADPDDTSSSYQDTRTLYGVRLIAAPLLDFLPLFVVFALLFVVTIRKVGGLWSTAQPQWGIAAVEPQAPTTQAGPGVNYMVQQPPQGWQQQPVPNQPFPYQYPPQQPGQQQVPQLYHYPPLQQNGVHAYQQPVSDPRYTPVPTPTQTEVQGPPPAPKSPVTTAQAELHTPPR